MLENPERNTTDGRRQFDEEKKDYNKLTATSKLKRLKWEKAKQCNSSGITSSVAYSSETG